MIMPLQEDLEQMEFLGKNQTDTHEDSRLTEVDMYDYLDLMNDEIIM